MSPTSGSSGALHGRSRNRVVTNHSTLGSWQIDDRAYPSHRIARPTLPQELAATLLGLIYLSYCRL